MDVFAMNEDLMMDRIFTFFDKKIDGTVTREEWVIGLSVVLRGELDELIAFAFFVYDLNQAPFSYFAFSVSISVTTFGPRS